MASALYNGKLIIASAEFSNSTQSWKITIDITCHMVKEHKVKSKVQAEQVGIAIAKEWIDKYSPDLPENK